MNGINNMTLNTRTYHQDHQALLHIISCESNSECIA